MNSALGLALVLQLSSASSGQDAAVHGYPSRLEGAEVPPGPGLRPTRPARLEAFAIFDLRTDRSVGAVSGALERYLRNQAGSVRVRTIRLPRIPQQPGRFQLLDAGGTGPARLTGPGGPGQGVEIVFSPVVSCAGAQWTATGTASSPDGPARFTVCLFPYRSGRLRGYHLDVYVAGTRPAAWAPAGRANATWVDGFISGTADAAARALGIQATRLESIGSGASSIEEGVN